MNLKKFKELKMLYEKNLKGIDKYQKIEEQIKKLQSKIKELKELQFNIMNSNLVSEFVDDYEGVESFYEFYKNLKEEFPCNDPKIIVNSNKVGNAKSTYHFFKEKLEQYAGGFLTLVEVNTPITKVVHDKTFQEYAYTAVHHLLLTEENLEKINENISNLTKNEYEIFLKNTGVFLIKEDYFPSYLPKSVQQLSENSRAYAFYLREFNINNKNILKTPLTPKYDKKLDDIMLDVLEYTIKVEEYEKIVEQNKNNQTKQLASKHTEK